MAPNSKAHTTQPDRPVDAGSPAYGLWAEGLRATYVSQNAAWRLGFDTFEHGQRSWWDQWQRMSEVTLAGFVPVTDRQLSQRFEAAERQAAERQDRMRADVERATADLRETQRESGHAWAQAIREGAREQRAARTAVDEAVDKLSGRLDRLAKALDEQLDKLNAALTEHEQRLRERLGDRIRSAVGAVEAARPSDLEELRRQVAALSEAITTTCDELTKFTREWREQGAPSGRPAPATGPSARGQRAGSEASSKE